MVTLTNISRFYPDDVKYIGRIILFIMSINILKFAAWMLFGWEVERGKVILHGNSNSGVKTVAAYDCCINTIHVTYILSTLSRERFGAKL